MYVFDALLMAMVLVIANFWYQGITVVPEQQSDQYEMMASRTSR